MGEILIGGMASLLICMFLGPQFIDYLRLKEFGQHIREEGPAGHHGKAGTPTMGGLVIFLAVCVPFLILSRVPRRQPVRARHRAGDGRRSGFADDLTKLRKRRSLGVSGKTKLLVQALTAIALWLAVTEYVGIQDTLDLRVVDASVDLGFVYPVLIFLVLAGATNGVNLTDGLDGLAAGCAAIVFLAFTAMTFITDAASPERPGAAVAPAWSAPASASSGSTRSRRRCSWATPARSGSAARSPALAVMTHTEVLLILIGGIFVIEALSVLIQVIAFQRFRKRVFLMAPIHHHFELLAWSETKIILRFWIVAAICSAIGFTLYQQSITP